MLLREQLTKTHALALVVVGDLCEEGLSGVMGAKARLKGAEELSWGSRVNEQKQF